MDKYEKPFGMKFGEMVRPFIKLMNQEAAKHTEAKLAIEQFGLLFLLASEKEELIQSELAEMLHKDKSTILRTVKALEKKELIRKVPHLHDKRKHQLLITKKGERALMDHIAIENSVSDQLLEGLSEEDLAVFTKVVQHIKKRASSLIE